MSTSILIADPDQSLATELKTFLVGKSYSADSVVSGKECQLLSYKNKYLAVVLDFEVKSNSCMEVLKYLRLNTPSVKVILSVRSRKLLSELELSEDDLKRLGASDILIKPYDPEKLLESIEGASQYESWKNIKASGEPREEEEIEVRDSEFTRIKVQDFYSGNATIFDCYVRLARDKYVKILHKGDFFREERLKKYMEKGEVNHLYFKTKDRAVYINFMNQVLEKMSKCKSVSVDRKVRTAKNLAEKYVEEVYTVGLKPLVVEEGKRISQGIYNVIQRDPDLANLMARYEDYDPPAYAHLFLVSFMSAVTCQNLDWASRRTVELIIFGSLLHDIGKLKLPENLRGKRKEDMSESELLEYREHPRHGAEMLQNFSLITEPIRQIVYQHHELVNGEGFPNGLTSRKIYPLAKVVSLCDEFSNQLIQKKVTPLKGLQEFIPDREKIVCFDPEIIKALVKGFIKK